MSRSPASHLETRTNMRLKAFQMSVWCESSLRYSDTKNHYEKYVITSILQAGILPKRICLRCRRSDRPCGYTGHLQCGHGH